MLDALDRSYYTASVLSVVFATKVRFVIEHFETLRECALFRKVAPDDIPSMLDCLSAKTKHFEKDEMVFLAGAAVTDVGIVLSGTINIEQSDYWGNRTILAQLSPGDLFGEAFSCAEVEYVPVHAMASEDSTVLLIDYRKILTSCTSACIFHTQLIHNMVRILAAKNVALTQKMETVTQRTTREKLLSYLSNEASRAGKDAFEIRFNRQELADYLSVDRSAMSNELSKMQNEGIIRFKKNHFELL